MNEEAKLLSSLKLKVKIVFIHSNGSHYSCKTSCDQALSYQEVAKAQGENENGKVDGVRQNNIKTLHHLVLTYLL